MRLALVPLIVAGCCPVALAEVCSSLHGPYCRAVNGRSPPAHVLAVAAGTAFLGEANTAGAGDGLLAPLVNAVLQALKEKASGKEQGRSHAGNEEPKSPYAQGRFQVSGSYTPHALHLELVAAPVQWVRKPGPGWVMVGFTGLVTKKQGVLELKARIVDDKGDPLENCSPIMAQSALVKETATWKEALDKSVWNGKYICSGLMTEMTLSILNLQANSRWVGEFNFIVGKPNEANPGKSARELLLPSFTEAGCECKKTWTRSVRLEDGKLEQVKFTGGECGNPGNLKSRDFCDVIANSCKSKPAGLNWDYCIDNWKQVRDSQAQLVNLAGAAQNFAGKNVKVVDVDLGTFALEQVADFLELLEDRLAEADTAQDSKENSKEKAAVQPGVAEDSDKASKEKAAKETPGP